VYVILGRNDGAGWQAGTYASPFNVTNPASPGVSNLDGSNGFVINGTQFNEFLGAGLATGDINDDGLADLAVSDNTDYGSLYILFGRQLGGKWSSGPSDTTHNWPSPLDLATYFDGTHGFTVTNIRPEATFLDLNDDGVKDLAIAGWTYAGPPTINVIFGQKSGSGWNGGTWPATINALSPPANCCVTFNNDLNSDYHNWMSPGPAIDFNADGIDDLTIGAPSNNSSTGDVYVVYGHTGSWPSSVNLSSLTSSTGFKITGCNAGDEIGRAMTSGDINGDGYPELMIGAPQATYNGNTQAGIGYVIYGKKSRSYDSLSLCGL